MKTSLQIIYADYVFSRASLALHSVSHQDQVDRYYIFEIDCEDAVDTSKHRVLVADSEVVIIVSEHCFESRKLTVRHCLNNELAVMAEKEETPTFALTLTSLGNGLAVYLGTERFDDICT